MARTIFFITKPLISVVEFAVRHDVCRTVHKHATRMRAVEERRHDVSVNSQGELRKTAVWIDVEQRMQIPGSESA